MRFVPRVAPLPVAAFGGPGDGLLFVVFPFVLFVPFVATSVFVLLTVECSAKP